ncbi:MAG: DUF1192 family protein [Caulobacteraceae bacterium]
MTDEPAEVRRGRGAALIETGKEDLDLFALEELEERIASLEAEIARVRAHMKRKAAGKTAAEALFSRKI